MVYTGDGITTPGGISPYPYRYGDAPTGRGTTGYPAGYPAPGRPTGRRTPPGRQLYSERAEYMVAAEHLAVASPTSRGGLHGASRIQRAGRTLRPLHTPAMARNGSKKGGRRDKLPSHLPRRRATQPTTLGTHHPQKTDSAAHLRARNQDAQRLLQAEPPIPQKPRGPERPQGARDELGADRLGELLLAHD